MFRKSRTQQVVDHATDATSTVKDQFMDKVVPAVGHAAEQTRDWAGPHVAAARDWAAPRAQKGLDAAAPKVEQAAQAVAPKIDAARDKLVDDVLPKLVDALNAATTQAAAARDEATSRGADAVAVLKGDAVARPKRRRGRKLLLVGGLLAGIGAAVAAFRSKSAKDDPWATPSGGISSSWAPTPVDESADEAAAATLDEAAGSEATEATESSEATEATSPATVETETTDLGSAQESDSTPDGDEPGKITPSARARKAKPRDDG